jgi:hypothetical protein
VIQAPEKAPLLIADCQRGALLAQLGDLLG